MSTHLADPGATTTPPAADGTRLGPTEDFPAELTDLPLIELQVLHSRICHQLEGEYLANPDGPHPLTRDRHHQLVIELNNRGRSHTIDGTLRVAHRR